jgi:hypothetical protein
MHYNSITTKFKEFYDWIKLDIIPSYLKFVQHGVSFASLGSVNHTTVYKFANISFINGFPIYIDIDFNAIKGKTIVDISVGRNPHSSMTNDYILVAVVAI